MGQNTRIEWAHHTFNPWWGCVKVSAGCTNCYAESLDNRFYPGGGHWGSPDTTTRLPASDSYWAGPRKWDYRAYKQNDVHRVFCGSMCDVFEGNDEVNAPRDRLWKTIRESRNLVWMLLTKRPENIEPLLPPDLVGDKRIWLGTSTENNEQLTLRWTRLSHHARQHTTFVSYEPAVEKLEFAKLVKLVGFGHYPSWVIAGSESGPRARPMDEHWIRSLRDDICALKGEGADIAFFYKQKLVNGRKVSIPTLDGRQWTEIP